MVESLFDDIRPYRDDEIPAAMARIAADVSFPLIASFVFPEDGIETVRRRIRGYTSIRDFQMETMARVNAEVIRRSMTEYRCRGLERLDPAGAYLYVSNHRDIVLDASLLQYSLVGEGFDTTEITFGANLMRSQLMVDIGKSNRMFRVERPGGSARDFYQRSLHLSRYIRHVICEERRSVWIAQHNGRTKDGNDQTDQGVIKMLGMSCREDKIEAIDALHVVPVAVSYEWESCDVLKTLELYQSQFAKYTKKPGEDLTSILTGIIQPKGRVYMEVCRPLERRELEQFSALTSSEYNKAVAALVSLRIIEAYPLFPNNYIAYDLLYGTSRFAPRYTADERRAFETYMQRLMRYDTCDVEQLNEIFLSIYANPVVNKLRNDPTGTSSL